MAWAVEFIFLLSGLPRRGIRQAACFKFSQQQWSQAGGQTGPFGPAV